MQLLKQIAEVLQKHQIRFPLSNVTIFLGDAKDISADARIEVIITSDYDCVTVLISNLHQELKWNCSIHYALGEHTEETNISFSTDCFDEIQCVQEILCQWQPYFIKILSSLHWASNTLQLPIGYSRSIGGDCSRVLGDDLVKVRDGQLNILTVEETELFE